MNIYYAPAIRPRKPARAAWFADIAAAVAMVFFIAGIGVFVLTGAEPLPDAVRGDAHRHFVAGLCPHLPDGQYQTCIDWLRKGGAK